MLLNWLDPFPPAMKKTCSNSSTCSAWWKAIITSKIWFNITCSFKFSFLQVLNRQLQYVQELTRNFSIYNLEFAKSLIWRCSGGDFLQNVWIYNSRIVMKLHINCHWGQNAVLSFGLKNHQNLLLTGPPKCKKCTYVVGWLCLAALHCIRLTYGL